MQRILRTLAVMFIVLSGVGACQSGGEILSGMMATEDTTQDFVSPMAMADPVETVTAAPQPEPVLAPPPVAAEAKAAPSKPSSTTPVHTKTPTRTMAKPPVKTPVKAEAKKPAPQKAPVQAAKNVTTAAKTPARKPVGKPKVLGKGPKLLKAVPPKTMNKKGVKAAKKGKPILMPVPKKGPGPLVANPTPVSWSRPAFLIRPVKGAPGDGNRALTRAIKSALRKNDLTITEDPRRASFVIQGKVDVSAPINGRQQARIVWEVNTMDGDEVGKAVQENAVKAGSLSGAWGRVADIVSTAAITGIQELFGIEKKESFRRKKEPKFSGRTDVPRIPGRALPPPR